MVEEEKIVPQVEKKEEVKKEKYQVVADDPFLKPFESDIDLRIGKFNQ